MKGAGSTLIELLVVIATIALLMGILVPSLQNSRQRAEAILCGSNVGQLALGLLLYETEYETFPYAFDDIRTEAPPGGYPGDSTYDRMGWWWFNHIVDYSRKDSGKDSVVWCPSRQVITGELRRNVLCGNYGVNQSICKALSGRGSGGEFIGRPFGICDVLRPGQTVLVLDSGYSMINWWHATDAPPTALSKTREDTASYVPGLRINKERDLWLGQEWDAINGRHPNETVNVGFADGHISHLKANDLYIEKTDAGYKNLFPLWLPR